MTSLDRWLWFIKVIGAAFSTITAMLAFWIQVMKLWTSKRKRKRKSLHRTGR